MAEQVGRVTWYHTISLPDGSSTDGVFDMRRPAGAIPWPAALINGRCLDIGTCDGFWAFEMERRGATEVVAIDVAHANDVDLTWEGRQRAAAMPVDQGGTRAGHRFNLARSVLGSGVKRLECSVYELDPAIHGKFDVVFCGTLLIHLRDPILALERMRGVCNGELIMVECVDAFLDTFAAGRPAARFEPAQGQWWRGNRAGLASILEAAGFEAISSGKPFITPFGAGMTGRGSRRRRLFARLTSFLGRWPRMAGAGWIAIGVGLFWGSYDIVIRARPRRLQGRDTDVAGPAHPSGKPE